jgi:uncharacterized DUF497 family protein
MCRKNGSGRVDNRWYLHGLIVARVVELAYTTVLEAVAERRAGSSPVPSTNNKLRKPSVGWSGLSAQIGVGGFRNAPNGRGTRNFSGFQAWVLAQSIALASLEKVSMKSNEKFGWDPAESAGNEAKHGPSIASATALWAGPVIVLPSKNRGELRHLAIGLIGGRHWTVVFAPRDNVIRLISARRSRKNEKALCQEPGHEDHHGIQPRGSL